MLLRPNHLVPIRKGENQRDRVNVGMTNLVDGLSFLFFSWCHIRMVKSIFAACGIS